jgi:hypothetical protein
MIEFEHTIFVLLLLTGVLNAKPPQQRWGILIILAGILLVFIPPALPIFIPWNLVIGLVVAMIVIRGGFLILQDAKATRNQHLNQS